MKRFIVTDRRAGVTKGMYDTIAEALAAAIHLQDEGRKIHLLDAQGSGAIMVNHFDVLEAEGLLGRSLQSEKIQHPTHVEEVLEHARLSKPNKTIYHWDVDSSRE